MVECVLLTFTQGQEPSWEGDERDRQRDESKRAGTYGL